MHCLSISSSFLFFFFFFSSRRRHTRFDCDWSSDVCSSDLDVNGEDILVLRNAGPKGAGMPEWGMLPIPTRLLKQGVKDMLRLSDARMSGTSYGGCLLHFSPQSAAGGPLGLVRTGARHTRDVS